MDDGRFGSAAARGRCILDLDGGEIGDKNMKRLNLITMTKRQA